MSRLYKHLSLLKSYLVFLFYSNLIKVVEPHIKKRIKKQGKTRVVFFVINVGMWKNDFLFRLLQEDKRFDPVIVSFFYPEDPIDYRMRVRNELKEYFQKQGFPYIDGYDFSNNCYIDLKKLHPDIIFYAQPSSSGYKRFLLYRMWNHALLAYSPYCISLDSMANRRSFLLESVCWRFFCPTEFHKLLFSNLNFNKGRNIVVSGYSMTDYLLANPNSDGPWKIRNKQIKRVIWAPHHSILSDDHLNYSTFLDVADKMLEIAREYEGKIQFAFKPHPRLIKKLYSLDGWGKIRAEAYYSKWNSMSNAVLTEGEYVDLFLTSDAMIHDCSSFTAEYLYTGKPVLYLSKPDHVTHLNDLGRACYHYHYKGESIEDIKQFLEEVVLGGRDTLKKDRDAFVQENLLPEGQIKASVNMYNELKNLK